MNPIFPDRLRPGDEIRIIAPSCAKASVHQAVLEKGLAVLKQLGLKVTWGRNTHLVDNFDCAQVAARVQDLHEAFADKNVKAILAVRGGFFANQLLDYIDWNVIKHNPKIFCGFSDITVLQNAVFAKTGLVTYSGPNLSVLGKSGMLTYTLDYFRQCVMGNGRIDLAPATSYQNLGTEASSDILANSGWVVLNSGKAEGVLLGGNLCTVNLLQGTEYMPSLDGAVLFLEDDYTSTYRDVDRNLQSLIHTLGFSGVKGLVFGRFQKESAMTMTHLKNLIEIRPELKSVPVLANVDFGHTEPKITFPIGGTVNVVAGANASNSSIVILEH